MTIMPGESRLTYLSVSNPSPAPFALPRRTGRSLPPGRHRSPHRLTLPSDAPALVLAVPGAARPASEEVAGEIAAAAGMSCSGAEVRVGYLEGRAQRLADALVFDASAAANAALRAVVVPLLAGPHPRLDAAIADLVGQAAAPIILAAPLGPHPLMAEALHARLAEAGLARESRARGLSIVGTANGVVVLADRGDAAIKAAGVTAVLLAARLAAPALPASLGDPKGIDTALLRLRDAGVSRPAIASCIIGPETDPDELAAASARTGAPCSRPLATHPAIGQLVAMRYGAALADLRLAGSPG
jgi:sirohydrochlorin ferrochelatase